MHRGAFCQFYFWWIYYYVSNKSPWRETGKTHPCAADSFYETESEMWASLGLLSSPIMGFEVWYQNALFTCIKDKRSNESVTGVKVAMRWLWYMDQVPSPEKRKTKRWSPNRLSRELPHKWFWGKWGIPCNSWKVFYIMTLYPSCFPVSVARS